MYAKSSNSVFSVPDTVPVADGTVDPAPVDLDFCSFADPLLIQSQSSTPVYIATPIEKELGESSNTVLPLPIPEESPFRRVVSRVILPTALGIFLGGTALPASATPMQSVRVIPSGYVPVQQLVRRSASISSPCEKAEQLARSWRSKTAGRLGKSWLDPHMATSPWDEVVMEWWHGTRKLTLYFQPDGGIQFIKVWGPDMDTEMEEGRLLDDTFEALWSWLKES